MKNLKKVVWTGSTIAFEFEDDVKEFWLDVNGYNDDVRDDAVELAQKLGVPFERYFEGEER